MADQLLGKRSSRDSTDSSSDSLSSASSSDSSSSASSSDSSCASSSTDSSVDCSRSSSSSDSEMDESTANPSEQSDALPSKGQPFQYNSTVPMVRLHSLEATLHRKNLDIWFYGRRKKTDDDTDKEDEEGNGDEGNGAAHNDSESVNEDSKLVPQINAATHASTSNPTASNPTPAPSSATSAHPTLFPNLIDLSNKEVLKQEIIHWTPQWQKAKDSYRTFITTPCPDKSKPSFLFQYRTVVGRMLDATFNTTTIPMLTDRKNLGKLLELPSLFLDSRYQPITADTDPNAQFPRKDKTNKFRLTADGTLLCLLTESMLLVFQKYTNNQIGLQQKLFMEAGSGLGKSHTMYVMACLFHTRLGMDYRAIAYKQKPLPLYIYSFAQAVNPLDHLWKSLLGVYGDVFTAALGEKQLQKYSRKFEDIDLDDDLSVKDAFKFFFRMFFPISDNEKHSASGLYPVVLMDQIELIYSRFPNFVMKLFRVCGDLDLMRTVFASTANNLTAGEMPWRYFADFYQKLGYQIKPMFRNSNVVIPFKELLLNDAMMFSKFVSLRLFLHLNDDDKEKRIKQSEHSVKSLIVGASLHNERSTEASTSSQMSASNEESPGKDTSVSTEASTSRQMSSSLVASDPGFIPEDLVQVFLTTIHDFAGHVPRSISQTINSLLTDKGFLTALSQYKANPNIQSKQAFIDEMRSIICELHDQCLRKSKYSMERFSENSLSPRLVPSLQNLFDKPPFSLELENPLSYKPCSLPAVLGLHALRKVNLACMRSALYAVPLTLTSFEITHYLLGDQLSFDRTLFFLRVETDCHDRGYELARDEQVYVVPYYPCIRNVLLKFYFNALVQSFEDDYTKMTRMVSFGNRQKGKGLAPLERRCLDILKKTVFPLAVKHYKVMPSLSGGIISVDSVHSYDDFFRHCELKYLKGKCTFFYMTNTDNPFIDYFLVDWSDAKSTPVISFIVFAAEQEGFLKFEEVSDFLAGWDPKGETRHQMLYYMRSELDCKHPRKKPLFNLFCIHEDSRVGEGKKASVIKVR